MDRAHVKEEIEAYALGSLDSEAEEAVRLHLATCPSCWRLLCSYEAVVAGLPEALAAVSPMRAHPAAKDRVMAGLDAGTGARPNRVRPWPLIAAAAVLMLAGTFVWGYNANRQLAHEHAVNAELQAKLRTRDQLTVFEVVDSPSTTKLSLRSTDGSNAYGKIFTKSDAPEVVVMVNRLPQPRNGETYELWLTSAGTTRLAGRLDVDSDGFAYLIYRADRKGPSFQAATVTLQALGGSSPGQMTFLRYQGSSQ